VEKLGMERSRELLAAADIILYIIDGAQGITGDDREFFKGEVSKEGTPPVILLWNKADLAAPPAENPRPHPISAKTGAGIPELTREIAGVLEQCFGGGREGAFFEGNAGIGTARQKELIDRAIAALDEALALAEKREPLDLIAPLLREGVNCLGEITGEVSTAEILDTMFSRFCVGK
jgi:tRNA modification GTPase